MGEGVFLLPDLVNGKPLDSPSTRRDGGIVRYSR